MNTLTSALAIMLGIQCLFFLAQVAMVDINPDASVFYVCEGSVLGGLDVNNCTGSTYVLDDGNPAGLLPSGETSVNPETGNIFTDSFTGIKSWFLDVTGLSYLVDFLSAPSNILKAIGLPNSFIFGVGALWYGILLFLIIGFLFGRDTG